MSIKSEIMKKYQGLAFTRLRIRLVLVFIVILLLLGRPGSFILWITGLAISLSGEAIRIWSSGHIRKSRELATSGPYAYTRNPLYVGSLLLGFGLCIASTSFGSLISTIIIWLYFLIGFCLIYMTQVLREEEVLIEKFGGEFEEYRSKVPPFLPAFSPYDKRKKYKFDFNLFRENHEYRLALAIMVVYLLFFLRLRS